MRLGIDFGTTRTVVAAVEGGRYPVALFEGPRGLVDYLPGLATHTGVQVEYGWPAAEASGAERTLRSIKRVVAHLAPDEPVPGWDAQEPALSLVTKYLSHLRTMLVERSNLSIAPGEPLKAMVAVPAHANTGQRYLTLEAFGRAGFEVVGMINEPTAAAIEFAHRHLGGVGKRTPKRYVIVYDLGGGTFDTSAISLSERRFELLRTEGIATLGGDDFDTLILEHALEKAGCTACSLDPSQRSSLLELCREAKEAIAPSSRRLFVDLGRVIADMESVVLDLSRLYEACQPMIQRTVDLVERIFTELPSIGIDIDNPRELGAVYLVGGGTSFPPVMRSLRRIYGRKIQLAPQPHAATAIGLAVACDPEARIFVREASTRHFGVWREAEGGRTKIFDPILLKDTLAQDQEAIVVRRSYSPAHSIGHLRFIECSDLDAGGQPAGDLTPWRDLHFPYDPGLADVEDLQSLEVQRREELASEQIEETYAYGSDGTLTIRVENRTHGYHRRLVAPWGSGRA